MLEFQWAERTADISLFTLLVASAGSVAVLDLPTPQRNAARMETRVSNASAAATMSTILASLICFMIFIACTAALIFLISKAPLMDDYYELPSYAKDLKRDSSPKKNKPESTPGEEESFRGEEEFNPSGQQAGADEPPGH